MRRDWIKAYLPVNEDFDLAVEALRRWAKMRETARHFAKAIRLYDSLLRGDVSLLMEFFPGFALAQKANMPAQPIKLNQPLSVQAVERSEEDELSEALDLFGGLDI